MRTHKSHFDTEINLYMSGNNETELKIRVYYHVYPGYDATYWEPGEPPEFEIQSIFYLVDSDTGVNVVEEGEEITGYLFDFITDNFSADIDAEGFESAENYARDAQMEAAERVYEAHMAILNEKELYLDKGVKKK